MGWEASLNEAKKGHRPRLKNWSRDGFASSRAGDFEALASRAARLEETSRCKVARESATSLSPEAFVAKYEQTATPVLITGVVDEAEWPAVRRWTPERLKEDFRDRRFKVGEVKI